MNTNKLLILFLLVIPKVFSQTYEDLKLKYPKEDVVTLEANENLTIDLVHDKLSIVSKRVKRNLFLTNQDLSYSDESISFNNFSRIENLHAFTDNSLLFSNPKKVRKRELLKYVKNFDTQNTVIRGIFYNDSKKKVFTYPAVNAKSITNLTYDKHILDPHLIKPFYLNNYVPIESSKYQVKVHKDVNISYKAFNIDSSKVVFTKSIGDRYVTYQWEFKNIDKLNPYYDFSPLYYLPQIAVYINSYKKSKKSYTVINDVGDLYLWYRSLLKSINQTDQTNLKETTLSLIEGIDSEDEKIKKIYYYVQRKINYIAFEFGMGGFIPRDAIDVYNKRYGDCKDMANLLNEMLHYANIESYLTWIGTRNRPYSYHDLPTAMADNHMIVAVKSNEQFIFLDPTAEYLSYQFPSPFIQGKEALIGISKDEYKIQLVEEVDARKNTKVVKSYFKIDSLNNLLSSHFVALKGYKKLDFHHQLSRRKKNDKDFIQRTLSLGDRKTRITDESYLNSALEDETIAMKFSSKNPNNIKAIDKKLYVKLHIDQELKSEQVKHKRVFYDKKIDYKFENLFESSFEIPTHYQIIHLPKASELLYDDYGFVISYEKVDNQVLLKKRIYINTLKVPTEDLKQWNNFIKKLNKESKKSIILEHKPKYKPINN